MLAIAPAVTVTISSVSITAVATSTTSTASITTATIKATTISSTATSSTASIPCQMHLLLPSELECLGGRGSPPPHCLLLLIVHLSCVLPDHMASHTLALHPF